MQMTEHTRSSVGNTFRIGDLVEFQSKESHSLFQKKVWNNKIGVISAIRTKAEIAYIKWSDLDLNDVWIAYEDLRLLNRE